MGPLGAAAALDVGAASGAGAAEAEDVADAPGCAGLSAGG